MNLRNTKFKAHRVCFSSCAWHCRDSPVSACSRVLNDSSSTRDLSHCWVRVHHHPYHPYHQEWTFKEWRFWRKRNGKFRKATNSKKPLFPFSFHLHLYLSGTSWFSSVNWCPEKWFVLLNNFFCAFHFRDLKDSGHVPVFIWWHSTAD